MALTAVFAADFDRFESALKSASFNLNVFDRSTAKAMQGLKRETEGFSGQKVAVEAARMAEAVTRLGGAGGSAAGLLKLLPEELKRVSAALDTAAGKAKLMGETLPPSLQKVRDEIAKMPQATTPAVGGITSLSSAFKALGPLLGVTSLAGAATAIARMGMTAIESAGQVIDLSKSLGLSTDAVQEMQSVANKTGTSIETFAAATFKLGVNVAEGSTKARDAIKDLGLAYGQLASMSPETQFRAVIKALEDVDNVQERNRLGTALFGKQFSEMSNAVAEGYSAMADASTKTSQAQLEALDRAGKAWDKFKEDVSKSVQSFLGNLVIAVQQIEIAADAMSSFEKLKLFAQSGFEAATYLQKLKEIGVQMEANAALAGIRPVSSHGPAATKAAEDYVAALKQINEQIADLKPDELKQLNAAIALGSDEALKYANRIGIGAEGLEVFKDHATKAAAAAKELAKDMAESVVWGGGIAEAANWMKELAKESQALELPKTEQFAKIFEMGPDIHMADFQKWLDSRTEALRRWWDNTKQMKLGEIFDFGPDPQIGIITEQMDRAGKSITGQLEKVFATLPDTLARAFEGGGGLAGAFKSIGVQIADAISEPIIKNLTRVQKAAVSAGATAATAFGGGVGGGMGATVAGIASGLGGAALAASAWGTSMAAAGVAGTVALGAATLGIGAAAVGVALLAKHFLTVGKDIKEARKNLEDFNEAMNETLTRQQRLEAGGQQWAATLIQVRDAMIALGAPVQEALAQSQALVAALLDTDNPARSAAALRQIQALITVLEDAKEVAGGIFDDILELADEGIPDFLQPHINQLIELGLLTDEQEKKLRELGNAGATNWKKVEEAAEKYGVRIESLGQPFQAQKVTADATSIINAFETIVNAGGDVGGVLFDMREEISQAVADAEKFGTTVPDNMRDMIGELVRTGQLFSGARLEANKLAAEIIKMGGSSDAIDAVVKAFIDTGDMAMSADEAMRKFGISADSELGRALKRLEEMQKGLGDSEGVITDIGEVNFGERIETEAEKTRKAFEGITEAIRELIRAINSIPSIPGGGGSGGGATSGTYQSSNAGAAAAAAAAASGGGGGGNSYNVNMQVDGRTVADAVINQMGNRLSVRGAR